LETETAVMVNTPHPIEEIFQMRAPGKTGVEKYDLLQLTIPCVFYLF
jgi:hypothetical protein